MGRWIALVLLACLLAVARPATADDDGMAAWDDLVRTTAVTFARPGGLTAKRRLVADLAASGRADAWVLMLAALEREGRHLEALARSRVDAWRHTQELWSRPRGQHHARHARRLRTSFRSLSRADQDWFRERMLIGQLSMRLREAPAEVKVLLRREATSPGRLLHPIARAALAPLLAADLGDAEGVAAYRALLERDPDERVRLAALDALPAKGPAVPALLMRRLRDPSWVVRVEAARRLAKRAETGAAEQLAQRLPRAGPREARALRTALRELGATPPAPPAHPVTLYGTVVPSEHVVFVLDASAAMAGTIERAKVEIETAIRALPAKGTFGLVVYSGAVASWQPTPVPATPENKDAAAAWLAGHEAGWNACLDGGLREAFRIADLAPAIGRETPIDTIAIVAAGTPTGYAPGEAGPVRAGFIERLVGVWNQNRRVRIQAVALGDTGLLPVLETITRENDGTLTRLER